MMTTYNPSVHRFAVLTVCWTVLLFVAGALVTSKDAALSVTDWPKSHGTWVPPLSMLQGGDLFEFSHRVFAGGLGILTITLALLLWMKEKRPWLRWLGVIAVLGVVVQAVLGGQVVIRLLHYWLPVIHACFAQIVFGAVLSIAVFTSRWWVSQRLAGKCPRTAQHRGTPDPAGLEGRRQRCRRPADSSDFGLSCWGCSRLFRRKLYGHPGRACRSVRKGSDARGNSAPQLPHDQCGARAGPGAQSPV